MFGEVGGNVRFINSLLEEDVSFDYVIVVGRGIFSILLL